MSKFHRSGDRWIFECPACGCCHFVNDKWQFNGDVNRPTVTPSILVRGTRPITDDEHKRIMAGERIDVPAFVCHSFVRDGRIEYCGDCTHEMRGQVVDLPEWEE